MLLGQLKRCSVTFLRSIRLAAISKSNLGERPSGSASHIAALQQMCVPRRKRSPQRAAESYAARAISIGREKSVCSAAHVCLHRCAEGGV